MEIATGYFAKAIAYSDAGYVLVSIAKKKPWFLPVGLKLHEEQRLAPTDEILELKDNPDEYEKKYRNEVLRLWNPYEIYCSLYGLTVAYNKNKVVLLCYEAPDKFCHRHIVAKWLSDGIGMDVHEATVDNASDVIQSILL